MYKAFILGNPRSGTSLLRLILNAHSKIAAPPESGFLQWWFKDFNRWGIEDSKNPYRVKYYVECLLSSKKIEDWDLEKTQLIDNIIQTKTKNYGDLCLLVYKLWALNNGKKPKVIVDKNNYYIHHLEEIHQVWNNARYIYCPRRQGCCLFI